MMFGCSVKTTPFPNPPMLVGARGISEVKEVGANIWQLKLDPAVASLARNEFAATATAMNGGIAPGETLSFIVDKFTPGYLYVYAYINGAPWASDFDLVIDTYRS